MTALLITAAVIIGIGLIRLGAEIIYHDESLTVRARIAGIPITLVPRPQKEKKRKKTAKAKKKSDTSAPTDDVPQKKRFSWEKIKLYIKLAADILRVFKRRIKPLWHSFVISRMYVYYTVASSDAANTAEQYGKLCAAVSGAYPVYREVLDIRHHDVTIDVDFCREKPNIEADVRFRITVGALVIFVITFAFGALIAYMRMKRAESRIEDTAQHKGNQNDTHKDKAVQINE